MDWNKKAPRYLFEEKTLIGTTVFITLFSIVFMLIYGPYSSTIWFDLHDFRLTLAMIAIYLVSIALLVVSKLLLRTYQHKHPMTILQLVGWISAEVIAISFIYSIFTELFTTTDPELFPKILLRTIIILTFIIIVPYIISALYATTLYQRRLLDRLGMNMLNERLDKNDSKLIHLIDNTGKLKMSINIDSLYYVESQDNYVKVYYESDGKICNYMLRSTTKAIESKFTEELVRCHRSYIVNKNKIKLFKNDRDGMFIKLSNDSIKQIPVSKTYSSNIQRILAKEEER